MKIFTIKNTGNIVRGDKKSYISQLARGSSGGGVI
jgi:hypothetical protein